MFGKKTKAGVKDGRLTIMTNDARHPGVVVMGLDQVQNGQFETAPGENGGTSLVFKPSGRKTADTIAVYNNGDHAAKALRNVYKALSGSSKGKSGFWIGLLKILGIAALIIFIVLVVLSSVLGLMTDATQSALSTDELNALAGTAAPAQVAPVELPVGEAFPVSDYIKATTAAEPQAETLPAPEL